MQFCYTYQDREGRVHEAEIGAPSKAEAYSALRQRGIRPMKVWDIEQGATSHRLGLKGKRWIAIGVLGGCLVFSLAYIVLSRSNEVPLKSEVSQQLNGPRRLESIQHKPKPVAIESAPVEVPLGDRIAKPRPRKHLEDAQSLFAKGALDQVFKYEAERFLACYAQPGEIVTSDTDVYDVAEDLFDALDEDIRILSEDSQTVIDLKRIVAGLKQEAAMRLAGGSTFDELKAWLKERQQMEARYRLEVIEGEGSSEQKNAKLRAMGLHEIDQKKTK